MRGPKPEVLRRTWRDSVLTGREHQTFADALHTLAGVGEAAAVEIATTSATSGRGGAERHAGEERILAENPFRKITGDRRGYSP